MIKVTEELTPPYLSTRLEVVGLERVNKFHTAILWVKLVTKWRSHFCDGLNTKPLGLKRHTRTTIVGKLFVIEPNVLET